MLKVVLDSNIFISGILFGGNPRKIISLILEGKIELFISSEILVEIKTVLERDKFGFPVTVTRQIVFEIESLSRLVLPGQRHSVVARDLRDNIIIDCAVEAGADYIITGDDDLLSMKRFGKIGIVSAAEFLKMFPYIDTGPCGGPSKGLRPLDPLKIVSWISRNPEIFIIRNLWYLSICSPSVQGNFSLRILGQRIEDSWSSLQNFPAWRAELLVDSYVSLII